MSTEVCWKGLKVYEETYDAIETIRKRLNKDGTRGIPPVIEAKLESHSLCNIVAAGIEALRLVMDNKLVER